MVDEIDERRINLLKENSKVTYVEIGNTVGLSEGRFNTRPEA